MVTGCSAFGTNPNDKELEKLQSSKQYNPEKKKFENRRSKLIAEMKKKTMSWGLLKDWILGVKDATPADKLPEIKPNLDDFLKPSKDLKVIWFGHSSFLLNMDGQIILVDPVFSGSAAPISFVVKRFQKPVLKLKELPEIDYILISHDHYDHLDMGAIEFFKNKKTKFITPLGVGSHLKGWGISKDRITEKDWWESAKFDGVEFIATPAQHFSGRNGIHNNETLWASWVLKSENHNIYFSGDSGYDSHFKEIGEKLGPFEIAFIENGQYNERWEAVHMLPAQSVQAFKDLNAKKYFPVHWGMFVLSLHTWFEPIETIARMAVDHNFELVAPKIGQLVNVSDKSNLVEWWKSVKRVKTENKQ